MMRPEVSGSLSLEPSYENSKSGGGWVQIAV